MSAKEAAFDYIKDFLCTEKEKLLFPAFPVAFVDETDSVLLDEARIPLVLAGNADIHSSMADTITRAVLKLSQVDYNVNSTDHQVWLTDAGIASMGGKLGCGNLYAPENAEALAVSSAALDAKYLLHKDKDYIVKDGEILVIDEWTSRAAENGRFPDLVHQAVEMQELGRRTCPRRFTIP